MKTIVSILLDEVIRNKEGEIIATKEFVHEVEKHGKIIEHVTREVVRLSEGRIVIDQVIHRSSSDPETRADYINFLTGSIE